MTNLPDQKEIAHPARVEVRPGVPAVRAHGEADAAGPGRDHGRRQRRRRNRWNSPRRGRVGGHRENLHSPREIQVSHSNTSWICTTGYFSMILSKKDSRLQNAVVMKNYGKKFMLLRTQPFTFIHSRSSYVGRCSSENRYRFSVGELQYTRIGE